MTLKGFKYCGGYYLTLPTMNGYAYLLSLLCIPIQLSMDSLGFVHVLHHYLHVKQNIQQVKSLGYSARLLQKKHVYSFKMSLPINVFIFSCGNLGSSRSGVGTSILTVPLTGFLLSPSSLSSSSSLNSGSLFL